MTKKEFFELAKEKIIILDGATGSNLQKKNMPTKVCPEQWILEHPEILIQLQKEYIEAGTDILYAPTFSGNHIKLEEYGLQDKLDTMNQELVKLSKEAVKSAKRKVWVAGDITMTGKQLYPIGSLLFEELVDTYKEQAESMLQAEIDLFVVETMMSLQECRAAVLAIKEICDLPIMVTLTFREDGKTFYGTSPDAAIVTLQEMGVSAVGVNCSTGPKQMQTIISSMKQYSYVPIIAKPNAGLPHLKEEITEYDMEPDEFALEMKELVRLGAGIVGGCCGTTPKHIEKLRKEIEGEKVPFFSSKKKRVLTTERTVLEIPIDGSFLIVGERINPTGKKKLQEKLKEKDLELVRNMAEEQMEAGAAILDINMGMNGIDEKEMMQKVIYELTNFIDIPLCIDSSYISVIEAALRIYPGRAFINSISLEKEKIEKLLPIAKKYGAMFILLPLSDKGLPKDLNEKKQIISAILEKALSLGFSKEDIIVDGLVTTIGANKKAAIETIETIRYCKKELGLATICGLSNISFGLPERQFINSTFLAFAIQEGLTMAIANPSQQLLVNTAFACDLLLAKKEADLRYIKQVTENPSLIVAEKEKKKETKEKEKNLESEVFSLVVKGNKKRILEEVKKELESNVKPSKILDTMLIPAINQVGKLFESQEYFLPQLIASAETMKIAIEYLEPMLHTNKEEKKLGTIVIATVSGDIHDIGKNLVALMLKNYGFEVIDLGKDVPTEKIILTAKEKQADIIGLSALMTTTMMEMKEVVRQVKQENLKAKVIIGGAVITQSFADEIGADGYSKDAQDAIRLVKELLKI